MPLSGQQRCACFACLLCFHEQVPASLKNEHNFRTWYESGMNQLFDGSCRTFTFSSSLFYDVVSSALRHRTARIMFERRLLRGLEARCLPLQDSQDLDVGIVHLCCSGWLNVEPEACGLHQRQRAPKCQRAHCTRRQRNHHLRLRARLTGTLPGFVLFQAAVQCDTGSSP